MSIHLYLYAEQRDGSSWILAEPQTVDERLYWIKGELVKGPVAKPTALVDESAPNRELSAVLCGMGYSWIEGDVEPISSPRGLPSDMSPELREWCRKRRGGEEYESGWVSLDEVLAYDWDQPVMRTAFVNPQHAHLFPDPPAPLTEEDWERIEANRPGMAGWKPNGVPIRWVETRRDLAWRLFEDAIPRLARIGDPRDIRLVFWHG